MSLVLPLFALIFTGCSGDGDFFSKTSGGVEYHFYRQNFDCDGVIVGDLITANVVFRTKDTVFFNSSRDLTTLYQFEILEPRFPGDIYDAVMIMCEGDSATFRIKGDLLLLKDFERPGLPGFIDADTWVFMDIGLEEVMPRDQFMEEKRRYKTRNENMANEALQKEQNDIHQFVLDNHIDEKPSATGLYYLEIIPGTGNQIQTGDTVTAHYAAMFINGHIFETTKKEIAVKNDILDSSMTYVPFRFIQGDTLLIPRWN